MKLSKRAHLFVIACFLCCSCAFGQSLNTSQIVGTVQDQTGAAIPGAVVVVTRTDTGFTRTVKTSGSGGYVASDLPLGPYKVQVSAPGFRNFNETGIVLQVGSSITADVKLQLGNVQEEVTVQANGVQVETVSNGIGQVINQQQVVELPLNGRDPTQLIALAGATTTAPGGDLNSNKNFPTITIAVAGGLPNGVAYVLDGGNHNDVFNNLNLPLPFPDALQEFKSETSSLPAQYGNHASAAINAVTKSGTNKYHGDLFYFVRNYMFNAANFFNYNSTTGQKTRDSLKRNQFGGVIGGPIKKDKLFFFAGYQGTIVRSNPSVSLVHVPTQSMLNGDFTAAINYANPATGKNCFNATPGSTKLSGPFVNNKIDPATYSPQALAMIKAGIPVVTDPTNPCGNFNAPLSANSTQHQVIGRTDYTLNSQQTMFARYLYARYNSPVTVDPTNILTANQVGQLNQDQALTIGHTYVITPNIVNSLRITGDRTLGLRFLAPFFDPASVGINAYANPGLKGFMGLSVTNGFSLGQGGNNPGYFNTVKYQLGDDVTVVRGNHSMAFGGQYLFAYMNTVNNRPTNGSYSFAGTVTGANSVGYADFLTGNVSSFSQGAADYENDRWNYVAVYAQDSWKITNKFTANYGLRWEPYIPFYNVNSHAQNFDLTRFTANQKSSVYSNAPVGLIFPGDAGFPGRSYNRGKTFTGFQPRVGFTFDPSSDGTVSIRGGYGLFYDTPQMFFDTRYSNSPPWGQTISLANTSLANPFSVYPGGNPFPGLLNLNSGTTFVQAGVYVNTPLNLKPMYLQQWNLSVQKQYKSWLFGATYLGNKTTHLTTSYEMDPATYIPGTSTGVAGSCGAIPLASLPKKGAACSSTGNTNARRLLYLQNPAQGAFYSTIGMLDDGGIANYNGMLLSVNRRVSVMNLVANYTWSHCLSEAETTELTGPSYVIPGNRQASYSNCDSDRRHVANVSMILSAPKFSERYTNLIVGGWGLSTILTARSGGYFTVTSGVDNALSGIGNQVAITTGNPYGTKKAFGTQGLLNAASFKAAATGTYAVSPPLTLHGPGSYELDMALT
ncbi:MAG: TonB-dependent receptor, partial [Granulicella sp.]